MKANEFIPEETLDEYSYTSSDISVELKKQGYKFLGRGVDQMAFLEPGTGQVLKIFGTQTRQSNPSNSGPEFTNDHKMFFAWAAYCKKHANSPFLPKFSGFESFKFDGDTYLQIRQERLDPLPRKVGGPLWQLSNTINKSGGRSDSKSIMYAFKTLDTDAFKALDKYLGTKKFQELVNIVYELYDIGQSKGWRLDLHDDNYMMRGKTPVIVDPWVVE